MSSPDNVPETVIELDSVIVQNLEAFAKGRGHNEGLHCDLNGRKPFCVCLKVALSHCPVYHTPWLQHYFGLQARLLEDGCSVPAKPLQILPCVRVHVCVSALLCVCVEAFVMILLKMNILSRSSDSIFGPRPGPTVQGQSPFLALSNCDEAESFKLHLAYLMMHFKVRPSVNSLIKLG